LVPENPASRIPRGSAYQKRAGHPSAFDVAIDKGDFELVSNLACQELTLEDYIEGFLAVRRQINPSQHEVDIMVVFRSRKYNRLEACRELGIKEYDLDNFCRSILDRMNLDGQVKVTDIIDGFVSLRRRLGCPDDGDLDWMITYRAHRFNRKETALDLGMASKALDKFLEREKMRLKIIARSSNPHYS